MCIPTTFVFHSTHSRSLCRYTTLIPVPGHVSLFYSALKSYVHSWIVLLARSLCIIAGCVDCAGPTFALNMAC